MDILEILVILVIALIVIPPEDLPGVVKAVGKMLRELRLASNMVLHELSSAAEDTRDIPEALRPITTTPPATQAPGAQSPAAPAESSAPASAATEPEKSPESPAQT